jgi:ferredoxin
MPQPPGSPVPRRDFLRDGVRAATLTCVGGLLGVLAGRSTGQAYVWQLDPQKCVRCGQCATACVMQQSAVRCVHAYAMCGYCQLCTGYFEPEPNDLNTAAENQLCPTAALRRTFVEDPYYEYTVDEDLCIGCARCVDGCTRFGNGSLPELQRVLHRARMSGRGFPAGSGGTSLSPERSLAPLLMRVVRSTGEGLADRLRAGAVGLLLLMLGCVLGVAEQRFPPPDFESGYVQPVAQFPSARALWLVWADVAVLVAALALASHLALRKRSRKGLVALSLFSVAYFGFYREGCICSIGAGQNVALALFDARYVLPLSALVFFVAPLVTALFFGRTFCAAVCPHGALQDLVLVKPVTVPRWLESGLGVIPYAYLGVGLLLAATGSTFLICRYDPFVPIFRMTGSFSLLALGAAFLVVGLFVGRPYCRFLCPYGALLRVASAVSKWTVRITPDQCTQCRLCEKACPFGQIREPAPVPTQVSVLKTERRRLARVLLVVPIMMVGMGWLGSHFAGRAAATLHPDVALADLYLQEQAQPSTNALPVVTGHRLNRAGQTASTLLPAAAEKRRAFAWGGWVLGAGLGLVVAARLLGLSIWRRQSDWVPDRGGCVACARCFLSCPQERLRLGLPVESLPVAAAPAVAARASTDGGAT